MASTGESPAAHLVEVGDVLPTLQKVPNEVALFVFSAATWNPHRIHYDRDYAHAEGHRDVVVQGSLQANWIVEALSSWAPAATLLSFSSRNVATGYVNDTFVVHGRVSEVHDAPEDMRVVVQFEVRADEHVTAVGTATVRLDPMHGRGS